METDLLFGLSSESLRRRWGLPELHLYGKVGSTNDVARSLAERGAAAGTVVLAREQVVGRGRAGRPWSSGADQGLWLSLVTRPPRGALPGALPLLAALQVTRVLESFLPPRTVTLKWPNDVVIGERKLAGVLCEAIWSGDVPLFAVVGVGVNLTQEEHEFPEELRDRAISLRCAGAGGASSLTVADRLIPALVAALTGPITLDAEVLEGVAERDPLRGHSVTVSDPGTGVEWLRGIAAGIDAEGALLVREPTGTLHRVRAGTVRRADAPPSR